MVAILVLLTVVGFVLADWVCQMMAARRERRANCERPHTQAPVAPGTLRNRV